jgi:hypothetical protein
MHVFRVGVLKAILLSQNPWQRETAKKRYQTPVFRWQVAAGYYLAGWGLYNAAFLFGQYQFQV